MNAIVALEKLGSLQAAGRSEKWCSCCEKQHSSSLSVQTQGYQRTQQSHFWEYAQKN